MRGGLLLRVALASSLLALIVGGAFVVLLKSVAQLRDGEERARLWSRS